MASRPGYVAVLVGSAAFVASCFLPYYDPGTLPMPLRSVSLFRLMTSFRESDLAMIGGFINLFAGVTIVAWVSIAGLRRHRWAPTALLAVSAAWSLTWIGVLLNVRLRRPISPRWLLAHPREHRCGRHGGDRRLDLEPREHVRQPSAG
jgi:hypothetical protein